MQSSQAKFTMLEVHRRQTKEQTSLLRGRVDEIRKKITLSIGSGWDSVRAIREVRQTR